MKVIRKLGTLVRCFYFVIVIVGWLVHASLLSVVARSPPKHRTHTQREIEIGTHTYTTTTNMQTLYNLIFLKLHISRDRFSMCVAVRFFYFRCKVFSLFFL